MADRVVDDLERAFQHLAEHPEMGHRREELTHDEHVLFWAVGPTVIAYRPHRSGVVVLFLERGERDWEPMLEESD